MIVGIIRPFYPKMPIWCKALRVGFQTISPVATTKSACMLPSRQARRKVLHEFCWSASLPFFICKSEICSQLIIYAPPFTQISNWFDWRTLLSYKPCKCAYAHLERKDQFTSVISWFPGTMNKSSWISRCSASINCIRNFLDIELNGCSIIDFEKSPCFAIRFFLRTALPSKISWV